MQTSNQHTLLDINRLAKKIFEKLINFLSYIGNKGEPLDDDRVVRYFCLSFFVVFECLVDPVSDEDEHN